ALAAAAFIQTVRRLFGFERAPFAVICDARVVCWNVFGAAANYGGGCRRRGVGWRIGRRKGRGRRMRRGGSAGRGRVGRVGVGCGRRTRVGRGRVGRVGGGGGRRGAASDAQIRRAAHCAAAAGIGVHNRADVSRRNRGCLFLRVRVPDGHALAEFVGRGVVGARKNIPIAVGGDFALKREPIQTAAVHADAGPQRLLQAAVHIIFFEIGLPVVVFCERGIEIVVRSPQNADRPVGRKCNIGRLVFVPGGNGDGCAEFAGRLLNAIVNAVRRRRVPHHVREVVVVGGDARIQ